MLQTSFGREGREERQKELVVMLDEAMASIYMLPGVVAQAIEDAEAERNRLEELAETDSIKTEQGSEYCSRSSMGGRPLSWLVPMDVNIRGIAPLVSSSVKSCMLLSINTLT